MQKTEINWTDRSWNPVTGCSKVSQGCKNCYAETIATRFWKDRKFTDVICHEDRLEQPLHIKKPQKIFVNSMSDLFHEKVQFGFIFQVYNIMNSCPQHIFQILTKRPERALQFYKSTIDFDLSKIKNIWLGVSVEDPKNEDRIEILKQTPAVIHWLSLEPLLGDLGEIDLNGINWVVVGCESGPKRRECKIEWAENVVDQCKAANIPVWVKQLQITGRVETDVEKFPLHLRIREFPEVK